MLKWPRRCSTYSSRGYCRSIRPCVPYRLPPKSSPSWHWRPPAYLALFLPRWTVHSMLGARPNLIAVHHISRSSPRVHTRSHTLPDLRERRLRGPLTRSPPGGVRRRYYLDSLISLDTSPADAASNLQTSVRLHQWGRRWRISFEPSKSQAMTTNLRRTPSICLALSSAALLSLRRRLSLYLE